MRRARDQFAAELIKVLSLRSTYALAAAALAAALGSAVFLGGKIHLSAYGKATFNPLTVEFNTGTWAALMLVAACAGAAGMTGEYHSGLIRTASVAVPDRTRTLLAKGAAYAAVAAVVGLAAEAGTFGLGRVALADEGVDTTVATGTLVRCLVATALALPVSVLLGLAFGTALRHQAVAPAAVVVVLALLPGFLRSGGGGLESLVSQAVPDHAWQALVGQSADGGVTPVPAPSLGLAWTWFLGWPCLALPAAGLVLRRRDL